MNGTDAHLEPAGETPTILLASGGRQTITVEEFAELVGVGGSTAYEAARRGEIPVRRIGRRYVMPMGLVRQWLGEADLAGAARQAEDESL